MISIANAAALHSLNKINLNIYLQKISILQVNFKYILGILYVASIPYQCTSNSTCKCRLLGTKLSYF